MSIVKLVDTVVKITGPDTATEDELDFIANELDIGLEAIRMKLIEKFPESVEDVTWEI